MTARQLAIVIATLFSCLYSGQNCLSQELAGLPPVTQQAMTKVSEGKLLAAVALFEAPLTEKNIDQGLLGTFRSFIGDWQGAHRACDRSYYAKPPKEAAVFSLPVSPLPALDVIAEQSKRHRVVVINEAHHVPQHRAFILQVLRKLRGEGFKYYAAEALAEDMQALKRRGYPTRSTGFYTQEPVFGNLVRESLAMGYQPVAYEAMLDAAQVTENADSDPIDGIHLREAAQCRNLVERLFAKDPAAKVVVHVGFDHVMERPRKLKDGKEITWMAARLASELRIELLSIDQTLHTERGAIEFATSHWRQAVENEWLDQPIVLQSEQGSFTVTGRFAGLVDMQVFHPPTKVVVGRPDWLVQMEGRVPISVPQEIRAEMGRVLVQAFLQHESEDSIPVDQALLLPGVARPMLLLKAGEYRVIAQDERGAEIYRSALVVSPGVQDTGSK